MIVDYSKNGSLCEAITKTLDGAHPCSLCKIVDRSKTSEKKSDLQILTLKLDMICTKRAITLIRPFADVNYLRPDFSPLTIGKTPPAPPPRNSYNA